MLFVLIPAFSAQTHAMDYDSDDEGNADRIVVHAPQYEARHASIEYAISASNLQFTSVFFGKHPEYVNTANCMGKTVLHTLAQLPCEQEAVDVIEKLLQASRLDLSAKSAEGCTPATCAYDVGNKRVCELLYKYGASDPETIMQEFVILDFDDGAAQDATIE
jgi:hypothetical protein